MGLLGQGNFSKVFRARHRFDGREYAVKRSQRETHPDCPTFARFIQVGTGKGWVQACMPRQAKLDVQGWQCRHLAPWHGLQLRLRLAQPAAPLISSILSYALSPCLLRVCLPWLCAGGASAGASATAPECSAGTRPWIVGEWGSRLQKASAMHRQKAAGVDGTC